METGGISMASHVKSKFSGILFSSVMDLMKNLLEVVIGQLREQADCRFLCLEKHEY